MKKIFTINEELENGNYYYADKKKYHIYPDNTIIVNDPQYFGLSKKTNISEMKVFTYLKGKKDITLDFCGAEIIFYGKIQPFLLDECENITIKNCEIKYNRPVYTEFEIVKREEDCIYLKGLNEKATYYVEDGYLIMTGEDWENRECHRTPHFFQAFDGETHEGKGLNLAIIGKKVELDPNYPFEACQYVPTQCGDLLKLEGKLWDGWTVGTILCYSHENRSISSVYTFDSNNITIENYRLINGSGMGISTNHSSNIHIHGLKLMYDEKSNGIIANAADAIHSIACGGDYEITNSVFEGMIDDALNIHGIFFQYLDKDGNKMHLKCSTYISSYLGLFSKGEKIALYNGPTMEKTAEYTIKKVELIDKENLILETEEEIGEHNENDLVENISMQPNITIKNCRFGKANSHLRFQSRGKIVVEDTEIGLPVLLTGDASYWFESSPVQDLTFKNVKFNTEKAQIRLMPEVMPTEKEPYYHKNIKFTDCEFVADTPIEGGYTDNIIFENVKNSNGKQMKMILTNCGSVKADGVVIKRKTEKKTQLKVN